ncbi:MAG TPA: TIGR03435 family protein, partial [Bryobacteraceae bacterium]
WAETEGYEIAARLPPEGDPSDSQLRSMLQHLLQSRFGLAFHMEKRDLPVYAISLGKNGAAGIKMTTNTTSGLRMGSRGLGRVSFQGATMGNLAAQLQLRVMDRPVIDQTGLTGRYDFTLDWRPDEFQFPAVPAERRAAAIASAEALPDLFTVFQEQLGLKLQATKAPTTVMVIDKVSKPSEN